MNNKWSHTRLQYYNTSYGMTTICSHHGPQVPAAGVDVTKRTDQHRIWQQSDTFNFENMPSSILFGAYCWPNTLSLPSSADKHQAGGVDQVGQVEDEVDSSEHGHRHDLIPHTQAQHAAAVGGPVFRSAMLGVKVEDGPDDGCWQVEDHGQQGVGG